MRISTLFLSSAALIASVTAGQSADLKNKKAAPVDFVKVCSINGAFTGFVIPGTDTCLNIGGFVRYQANANQTKWTYKDGVKVAGRTTDALSFAAVGSVKVDARQTTEYGLLRSFADFRVDNKGAAAVDKAYIQFGGLHAGKIQSVFDFYADDASYGNTGLGSDHSAISLGYSAQFGNGLYGVVAVEDRNSTKVGDKFNGQRAPDLVAAFGVEQSWGAAKLSSALHQLNVSTSSSTEYGYSVQAGVKLNLVGGADALFVQAGYADGAIAYLGQPGYGFGHLASNDAVFNDIDRKKTKGWNALAAYEHAFSDSVAGNVFGGYTVLDNGNAAGVSKVDIMQGGVNLAWSPVKGFKVVGEVSYFNSKFDRAPVAQVAKKSDNAIQSLIRIQRDF
jgi:hypothetical protein